MSRTVLVTGGASGFGAEVARQLVRRGDRPFLVDVDVERLEQVAGELAAPWARCDVSSFEEVVATTQQAEDALGGLDAVFLNAGISTGCGVGDDFDPAKYRRAMGVNIDGVVFGVHAALPALRRRGGGSIVATASMAGLTATPVDPVYVANKHAVVGLVRSLGFHLGPQGIRVNAFCPAFAETGIIEEFREFLDAADVPVIPVEVAGESVLRILDSEENGQAWLLQAGREVEVYRFRGVPGPLKPDGSRGGTIV